MPFPAATGKTVARIPRTRCGAPLERGGVAGEIGGMKTTAAGIHREGSDARGEARPRFQIYRQSQAGNYHPEFGTDSAADAVEAFLAAKPAFEGGAVHLWDHFEQRSGASIRWRAAQTEFGFVVSRRINLFHDPALGSLAREILDREALRQKIQQSVGMSV